MTKKATQNTFHKKIPLDHISDLENLFNEHYQGLCAFVARMMNDSVAAEDIVQEVFMKVWRDRHTLTFSDSMKSYLYLATKNGAINYLKKQRRRTELLEIYLEGIEGHLQNVEDFVHFDDLNSALEKATKNLPPKCMEIFLLSRNQFKSYKEISIELGISVKTVENQIGKALKILRSQLQDFLLLIICIMNLLQ